MARKKMQSYKTAAAVAIPEALTSLLAFSVLGYQRLVFSLTVADNALDQFAIKVKNHGSAPQITLYSAAGDFTGPAGLILEASGDLTAQAVGSGLFVMDVAGLDHVEVLAASGNVAGSNVLAWAMLQ